MIVGYYVKLVLRLHTLLYEAFPLTKNKLNVYKANLNIVRCDQSYTPFHMMA